MNATSDGQRSIPSHVARAARTAVTAGLLVTVACGDDPLPPGVVLDARWTDGVPLPAPMSDGGAAVYRGEIYVGGGFKSNDATAAVFRFNPATEQWTQIADLPTVRVGTKFLVINDSLFAAGGFDAGQAPVFFEDLGMWVYDPDADAWLERPRFPDKRAAPGLEAVDGKIFLVGGGLGSIDHGGLTPGDTVAYYTVSNGVWTYGTAMPRPRSFHGTTVVDDVIYLFGGWAPHTDARALNEIEAYDPITDTWTIAGEGHADQLEGVAGSAAVVHEGAIHFIGGFFPPGNTGLSDHVVFHPATGTWEQAPILPTPRGSAAAVSLDGKIYVMGGQTAIRNQPGAISSVVEIFEPNPPN